MGKAKRAHRFWPETEDVGTVLRTLPTLRMLAAGGPVASPFVVVCLCHDPVVAEFGDPQGLGW